jgi:hypothetical protein
MKLLPKGMQASRMRCSTSAVSTSKYWAYGLSENQPPSAPNEEELAAGAGALGGGGKAADDTDGSASGAL